MCPRTRAMSQSRSGSPAVSRAAVSKAWARPAWPQAQALRAAANLSSARCGRIGGKLRRALVRGERRDVPTASPRPGTDELESRGEVGVRPRGGCGAVPGFAVGVAETGQGVSQRLVRRTSLLARGGLIDRRADEWVTHLHRVGLDDEESGGHGVLESLVAHAKRRGCTAYDGELAGVVRGRHEQQ